jgi:uncharacterized membrane protein
MPRLPGGMTLTTLHLSEVDRIFPLTKLPEWAAGRLFYDLVRQSLRWLLVPLIVAYTAYELIKYAIGDTGESLLDVAIDLGYDLVVLVVVFGLFVLALRGMANQAIRGAARRFRDDDDAERLDPAVDEILRRLESGQSPPLGDDLRGEIAVFASGHTHAPSLVEFDTPTGSHGAAVNSGCWLRQAHPVPAHLNAPAVFVPRFVLTYARVHRGTAGRGSRSSSGSTPTRTVSTCSPWSG